MNRPVSIFDGWAKKIEHEAEDGKGGHCAIAWLIESGHSPDVRRIGQWIINNLDPPDSYIHKKNGYFMRPRLLESNAVIWANNECKLDIDGFKMADLLSSGYTP